METPDMDAARGTPPAQGLFDGYAPPGGSYDEAFAEPQRMRPHWEPFRQRLDRIGTREFQRRWKQAERMVRENGVTYNAYSDPLDEFRPWQLDPLPVLIEHDEWERLTDGLRQRARLLDMVLADLYGPRTLLARGVLPAELLYAHPGFHRGFCGLEPPGNRRLHFYAADAARSPDGNWWVVADRTQAPSGAGYALENRIVISRMLPGVIRDCHVQRLAPFFMAWQAMLRELASHADNPRVALLSPGPNHPNYFEDAYLSRYLGYTLVESDDLSVRNNRPMLKTLGGLLPIDVILRRLDEQDCDPLEPRSDSRQGVAGLVHAARSRQVAPANGLGSGLVQAPALLAFLPGLCRELLGEPLRIPSVATWWCGGADARRYVLENLQRLVVRPAFRQRSFEPIFGESLTAEQRRELAARIEHRPEQFVAQEKVARSTAPVWRSGRLHGAHVAIRGFLVASGADYTAMPGGLLRCSSDPASLDLSLSAGEGSKDLWVLSHGPVHHASLLPGRTEWIELRRGGSELPSRVAENLFWLGRHVERAEGAARLLRTVLVRLTGDTEGESPPELPGLLHALAAQGHIEPGFVVEGIRDQLPAIEQALPAAVFDPQVAGTLRHTLSELHRGAAILRDRISADAWRIINRMDQQFQPPDRSGRPDLSDLLIRLSQLTLDLAAFSGLVMESMTRGQGWRFLDLGRRIERAMHTIGLLRNTLGEVRQEESPLLEAVLEVADSLMTYRSRYMTNLQLVPVLDLLLTDESNPRGVAFQLAALADHARHLPRPDESRQPTEEQQFTADLLESIRSLDLEEVCRRQSGRRPALEQFLEGLAERLPRLSDEICHKYLMHVGPARQLDEFRF